MSPFDNIYFNNHSVSPLLQKTNMQNNASANAILKSNQADKVVLENTKSSDVKSLEEALEKTKQQQGLVGKSWDGIKNLLHFKSGSAYVKQSINDFNNGKITIEQAKEILAKYQDGQNVCVDTVADIVSSIFAVGVFSFATGGLGLPAALGLSFLTGAGIKTGGKAFGAKTNDREYNSKNLIYDVVTGGVNGLFAPITNGLGSNLTKTIGAKFGLEIVGDSVEAGAKTTLKSILLNQSIDVTGGTIGKRAVALASGMALDGALGGTVDNTARAALDKKGTEGILQAGLQGFVGGLIMSPIIGGGFRMAGKLGKKLSQKIFKNNVSDAPTASRPSTNTTGTDSDIDNNILIRSGDNSDIISEAPKVELDTDDILELNSNANSDITSEAPKVKSDTDVDDTLKSNTDADGVEILTNNTVNISKDVVNNLRNSLKTIPKEEQDRVAFLTKFMQTNLYTGENIANQINDGFSKEISKLAKLKDSDLIPALEFSLQYAEIIDDKQPLAFLTHSMESNFDVYKNIQKRNAFDILKSRKQYAPIEFQKEYANTRLITYLGTLTDNEYKKVFDLLQSVGIKDSEIDLHALASFAIETNQDTINYMVQHNLFDIKNVPYFKDKTHLLGTLTGYKKDTVQKMHQRGLLQPIAVRDNEILSIRDAAGFADIPDEKWKIFQDRNIFGLKRADGKFINIGYLYRLVDLSDVEWERILSRDILNKAGNCGSNIITCAKLSDAEWDILQKRAIPLNKGYYEEKVLETLIYYTDDEWQKGQKRGLNLLNYFDRRLLEFDDDAWKRLTTRGLNKKADNGHYKYDENSIISLAQLDDKTFEQVKNRGLINENCEGYSIRNPLFSDNAQKLAQYSDETYKLYIDRGLDKLEVSSQTKDKLLNLTDKQFERIEKDIKPFSEKYSFQEWGSFDSKKRNTIDEFIELVYLSDDEYKIAKEFLGIEDLQKQNQFKADEIMQIIKLDPKRRERIKQIVQLQVKEYSESKKTNANSTQKRYNADTLIELSTCDDNSFKRLSKLISLKDREYGFEDHEIVQLVNLSDSEFEQASRFFVVPERQYSQFSAQDVIQLSRMPENEVEKLRPYFSFKLDEEYLNVDAIKIISQFDNKKLQRFNDLSNIPQRSYTEQFHFDEMLKFLDLSDEDYQRAQKLFFINQSHKKGVYARQLSGKQIIELIKHSDDEIDWLLKIGFLENVDNLRHVDEIIKFKKYEGITSLRKLSKKDRCEFLFNTLKYAGMLKRTNITDCLDIPILPQNNEQYAKLLNEIKPDLFELAKKGQLKNLDIPNVFETVLLLNKNYKGVKSIDSLSIKDKRKLLNNLIKYNRDLFGIEIKELCSDISILPKNKDEYCALLPKLIKSIGISTNELSDDIKSGFYKTMSSIEAPNSRFRTFDFEKPKLKLDLTYSREQFVSDMANILAPLSKEERNLVCDYFGFELISHNGKHFINGYPVNLNNGVELAQIESPHLKQIIEKMRPLVKNFSENNSVIIKGEPELNKEINGIIKAFPEFITEIGKKQHHTHDYTLDIHSLKVLQGVINNPKYDSLPEDDKIALKIAALLHDITKQENLRDALHPYESAYDTYYILQKLNLSENEKLKIYQIVKDHNWLQRYNATKRINGKDVPITAEKRTKIAKDIAFDLRKGNSFKMASILAEADMQSVKRDGKFFKGLQGALEQGENEIGSYVKQIKESAIHLPQAKIPKASEIKVDGDKVKDVVTTLADGSKVTNRVLYLEPNMDLSKYGFSEGLNSNDLNVLIHALDDGEQSIIFQALGQVDSDALLSSSYVNYGLGNFHAFRNQGFILDVDSDDINAGYYRDFGSGCKKDLDLLKSAYLFDGMQDKYRKYVSKNLRKILKISTEEYFELYPKIKNKSIIEIDKEFPQVGAALRELFKTMEGGKRSGGREYNEMLITRPKIQAVFDYGRSSDISNIPDFLRQYAAENDFLVVYFGK